MMYDCSLTRQKRGRELQLAISLVIGGVMLRLISLVMLEKLKQCLES
jgi:hypothetical protein